MGKQARHWTTIILASAVAAWIAASLVPAYRVDGALAVQCSIFLLTGAVFAVVHKFLPWPAYRALRPVEQRAARMLRDDEDDTAFGADSDWDFFAPIRFLWLVMAIRFLIDVAVTIVVSPVAFWLGAMLAVALGLPVHLDGLWPTVVAGLVVQAVRVWLTQPLRWLTGTRRMVRAVRTVFEFLIPLGGIAAAVVVVGGVHLDPGTWTRQLLTVVVLTALFLLINMWVSIPSGTTLLRVAGNGVKLWLVALLSVWMDLSLRIDGFWSLVLAALVVTVGNWFLRLVRPPNPPPRPDPLLHDPFWPSHHIYTPFW